MRNLRSFMRGLTAASPAALALTPWFLLIAVLSASLWLVGCGGSFELVPIANLSSPTITSLTPASPTADSASFSLGVNGTSFTPTTTSKWGTVALVTNYVSTTQLTVIVPASLITTPNTASLTVSTIAGTASVTVSTTGGATPDVELVVTPAPTLTSLSPTSTIAGSAAFTLTIAGTNFSSTAVVNWGSTPLTTTYVSATKLTAAVPASLIAATGTASVTVTTAGGTSSGATFTINPPIPTVTSVTPNSVVAGASAFTLTINGANFLPGTLDSVARWSYTALTTTYVSATQLTAVVPASLVAGSGTANISVVTAGGTSTSVPFTINPAAPAASSLAPSKLSAGFGAFSMYVYGTYFTSTATINWGATPLVTTFVGSSVLLASVPANLVATSGTASVTVTTAGGTSSPLTFTITPPQPTVTSLSPASATTGGAAFTLTINGTNFLSTTAVYWNSTHLTTTYICATQLTAKVPATLIATAGTATVMAYTPSGGGWSTAVTLAINPAPPTISSLSPASATAGGAGFMLTINGTAFTAASTSTWGTTALGTIYVSPTQLTAAVPASLIVSPSTGSVTVTTEAGTSAPATFTINPAPPVIGYLSPGLVAAGGTAFTLNILGEHFTSASTVKWGSTALAATYFSDTVLTAAVPAKLIAATGTTSVTVSTSAGTSSPATFTINPALAITTSSLPAATAGNAYSGPITVTGGVPGYNWTVTGLPATLSYFNTSDSTLTVTGTPASVGAITFQVSVEDTTGTLTGPMTYIINVASGPSGANNANINGSYLCLLQGFVDDDSSRSASIISFQADGQGNFTSGIIDTNGSATGSASGTMTGSYKIGADNNGMASIHTVLNEGAAGIQTTQWAVALSSTAQPAQHFRMVEADDLGTFPSGQHGTANCYRATTSAFTASTISGNSFVFGLDGEDNSGTLKVSAGLFSASGGKITSGMIDSAEGGSATVQSTAFTGSYTVPDPATGRFTIHLNASDAPTGLTVYIIDAHRMFVLDNTSNDGEQAGNMRLQQQASYSATNLSGPFVLYRRGAEFNSSTTTPSSFYSGVFEGTGDSAGNMTINQSYTNDAGSYSAVNSSGPSALTFDSTYPGRVTFPSASGTSYLYLFNTNSAFAMSVNANGSLDSGWLEPQTQTTFTDAALAGNYLFGELPQLNLASNGNTGVFDLTGSGTISGSLSTAGEENSYWNQSTSMAYAWDATSPGTGTFLITGAQGQASCAVINAAKFVCASQTDSSPSIQVFEQ